MSTPMIQWVWYWGSTLMLGVLLFFPISKVIWVMRVRREERRLGRTTTEAERQAALRSARIIAAFIAVTFAFLFNRTLIQPP